MYHRRLSHSFGERYSILECWFCLSANACWEAANNGSHVRAPAQHVGGLAGVLGSCFQNRPFLIIVGISGAQQLENFSMSLSLSLALCHSFK